MNSKSKLSDRFAEITGSAHVITSDEDMASFLDEPRHKFHGRAACVVVPGTTDEVARVLALASATGTPVVPQGGNTGLVGGQVPDASATQVILSLSRMNRIIAADPVQNTLIAQAGCTLHAIQEAAAQIDRLFPLSLAAEGTCTIGGNLSTNAGGISVVHYGTARDLCLGLEVVLADGRIWSGLNTLRKNNTGVDLKHLFIGSEGTLGVITAASLKLFAPVHCRTTALCAIPEPQAALDLLNLAQKESAGQVTSIELMGRTGFAFTLKNQSIPDPLSQSSPWYVLIEISAQKGIMEQVLEMAMGHDLVSDAVIAQSESQRVNLWKIRETLPASQAPEGGSIKHDVSLPLSKVDEFIKTASAAVKGLIRGARPVAFGHVGDGNIHFNISQPEGADKAAFLARWDEVNELVHGIVLELGGSVSAEHGIGQLKRQLMTRIKTPVELDMMRKLKHVFDPQGILNPGKLLPGETGKENDTA